MGRIKLDSINEFARRGYLDRVTCGQCENALDWNLIELMRELHRKRVSLVVEQAERRLDARSAVRGRG